MRFCVRVVCCVVLFENRLLFVIAAISSENLSFFPLPSIVTTSLPQTSKLLATRTPTHLTTGHIITTERIGKSSIVAAYWRWCLSALSTDILAIHYRSGGAHTHHIINNRTLNTHKRNDASSAQQRKTKSWKQQQSIKIMPRLHLDSITFILTSLGNNFRCINLHITLPPK